MTPNPGRAGETPMVCEQAAGLSIDLDCAPQETAVPRYYFDLREGETFAPDEDGLEFADLDTAEYEAARMAADIGRERLPVGDARDVTIEVRDEHGRHLLTVTVSMRINRVEPAPTDASHRTISTST